MPATVIEYTAPVEVHAETHAREGETIEQMAQRIAEEYGVKKEVLFNLIECESEWNPKADNGLDRGLVQINRKAWPNITDEQAFDPEFSLRFAAEKIAKGQEHYWTCANCYSYVVTQLGKLPRMADIIPNTPFPRVEDIIIFDYNGKKHIAVQDEVVEEGIWVRECNYIPSKCGKRLVRWGDKAVVGYRTALNDS